MPANVLKIFAALCAIAAVLAVTGHLTLRRIVLLTFIAGYYSLREARSQASRTSDSQK